MLKTSTATFMGLLLLSASVFAAETKPVEYSQRDQKFEGLAVTPTSGKGVRPGVLVVPNWMGIGPEARKQAERIADLGYAVFVADVYGKGVRPTNPTEAGAQATKYKGDRKLFRERLKLAFEQLQKMSNVDKNNLFAAGYCFGGTGVLELARAGAPLVGVVTFHGGLDSPNPNDGANIKAKVLALHGADDPFVSAADLAAFEKEMAGHKVDWQLVKFGNAVHSFTDQGAGSDNSKGAAYNAAADARSFEMFKTFLTQTRK